MKQSVNASKSGVSNIVLLANGENPNVKSRAIPCEADNYLSERVTTIM